MARRTKRLFTIGYEQTPSKAVLDELEAAGVKLLVDVRAVASSRRPGFSKNQLAAGLDERGISYLHLRGLGTPKSGREAARSGKFGLLHKIYSAHLKTAQAKEELDELSALVNKSGPVCILCYERDHAHCHRQWIAEIIEERDGVKVENLVAPQVLDWPSARMERSAIRVNGAAGGSTCPGLRCAPSGLTKRLTPCHQAGTFLPSSARNCRRHGWRRPRHSACARASAAGSAGPCRRPARSSISVRRP